VITLKGESPQSWTGYAVFVTASWLMETAGLGNSTEPKMGYTLIGGELKNSYFQGNI
jgi:hypothetical protein